MVSRFNCKMEDTQTRIKGTQEEIDAYWMEWNPQLKNGEKK